MSPRPLRGDWQPQRALMALATALVSTAGNADGAPGRAPPAATLCTPAERPLFSCPVARGRTVSICATAARGAQYRFGRRDHIELAFPGDAQQGPAQLLWSQYSRAGVERLSVRFDNGDAEYIVHDWMDESRRRETGVMVTVKSSGLETRIPCQGRAVSRPAEIASLLTCDRDSALAQCK